MRLVLILLTFLCSIGSYSENVSFESFPSWIETFDGNGIPNPKYWNFALNSAYRGSEKYSTNLSKIIYLKKGKLNLIAKKNTISGDFVEPIINTRNKITFLYGKLEIRAKCPIGAGIWPAIWLIKPNKKFPTGEIDILEYIDCWKAKSYQINVHTYVQNGNEVEHKSFPRLISTNVSIYHIYALEWYRDRLVFLLDDKVVYEYKRQDNFSWTFNEPYFLILNITYGGWGGTCGMDDSIFPCKMKIDWIKYYKLKE